MCDHRPVAGNAAAENDGRANRFPAHESIDDVPGDTLAQAIAYLGQRKAFLLGVSQVGLGEDGAAGGNFRRGPGAPEGECGELPGAGEIQAPGLLIEEAAGAGRAGGVGLITGVVPGGVELNEAEALAADVQDGADISVVLAAARDQGHQAVVAPVRADGVRGGARNSHPHPAAQIQLCQEVLQRPGRIPAVEGIGAIDPLPVLADHGQGDRHRSDIDADDQGAHDYLHLKRQMGF